MYLSNIYQISNNHSKPHQKKRHEPKKKKKKNSNQTERERERKGERKIFMLNLDIY